MMVKQGATNGDNQVNSRLNKKDYNRSVIPAILGRLGKHTNKPSVLQQMHQLNSFRYVNNKLEACSLATQYWDERNMRMASNIITQIEQHKHIRNVVVVGAGHVIGLRTALEKQDPNLIIKLIYE